MTAREAYKLLTKNFIGIRVAKCYEYDSVFVFRKVPVSLTAAKKPERAFDVLLSVDKQTGLIRDFKPYRLSSDEFKRGKEVSESEYKRW